MKDLKYILAYLLPISTWFSLQWLGAWSWATVVLVFGFLPVLDAIWPISVANASPDSESKRTSTKYFDWLLYANVPIVFSLIAVFFQTLQQRQLSIFETLGITLSVGIMLGSSGINVAHELGHRSNKFEQFLSKLLLLPELYMHFFIEHNRGHHKHIATEQDPASAPLGKNIYAFWLSSMLGQYKSAWRFEVERLEKEGNPIWGWQNEMIRFAACQFLWLLAIGLFLGWNIVPFALAIALVGVLLLESVNYIEHYGLRRKILPSGRPEPVSQVHSWNSDHEMGRIFLYELTRHSDHHFKSTRKYQILRHYDESPQLPTGYPGSILIALLPPIWFGMMDKRAIAALG